MMERKCCNGNGEQEARQIPKLIYVLDKDKFESTCPRFSVADQTSLRSEPKHGSTR
jgi:hypothetical protein